MPLTNQEKADIAMGDKICNEKISEEASSRIKKDLIIDSKINKLQEQINNLSKSKNEDKKQDELEYIMDAQMSDIPKDGVISKLLIFRNYPLNLENMTLTKKQGTLGSILVIGNDSQQYGDFTDFKNVPGLESIAPASKSVQHKMNNVILKGLGNNTDDKDINALTLVNLSNNHQFNKISVIESEDDGIEIFGGSVNMSNITVADAKDDYFDTDHGHSGTISNLKLSQSSNWRGKSLIECGNKKGSTTTKFTNLTFNSGSDVSKYVNNGSDKNFNIKSGSKIEINGVLLTAPKNELPELEYIMDAQMSDIPKDGILDKILIFRNYPLNLENMTLSKKQGHGTRHFPHAGTLGAILVIGNDSDKYGDFTDFKSVPGLESIAPASKFVQHKMNNVILKGLGNNTVDKDINALTLVNLSSENQFSNISVMESEDDGIEIFGGSVNMSNITVADAKDDYFDTDHGHSGTITNLNLNQTSNWRGNSLIECGNKKGTTKTKFVNLTYNTGSDVSKYVNNGSDKNFNIKSGSQIEINGVLLTAPQDELPEHKDFTEENTNKLDTLGKDLGNTHYLALRPLFTEEKDDFLKNSNNKSCVNIIWESFSLNNESYNDTIIEKARIIFQGKTNGLPFTKDTAIALKEKTYFNTGTTTTTPEILWSVDVQTGDDEVLKDLKFVNIIYKDTKWRELSFLDKDMNEIKKIPKMYYFVSSKYSQKHKDFMNANKI